jgi:hypothetical protein
MTFGGGLVGGDSICINFNIGNNCAGLVTSQESTKVENNNNVVITGAPVIGIILPMISKEYYADNWNACGLYWYEIR